MRRFNPEKELYKIQHGNRNKILYGIIALLLIISIGSTYALYQVRYSKRIIYTKVAPFNNKDINILAVYLDGQLTDKFPEKGSKVVFDKIVCDNGSTGAFNTNTWKLILEAEGKDKCSVYFKTTTDYIDDSGANPPELYQGLIPVTFDAAGKIHVANLTENWYDYDEHRWANAVLVDYSNEEIRTKYFNEDKSLKTDIFGDEIPISEVLQMYVWIPRYKYQLFNVDNGSINPQEIQIEFESGILSTGTVECEISDKGVETCDNAVKGEWYTHPAFSFGNSTKKEENTQLKGIWIGKFESSGSITDVKILPNFAPIQKQTVYAFFTASRNIEEINSEKHGLDSKQIDTHMMKNMEWGAMAYLTHSKYGRCDGNGKCVKVTANSTSFITGYDNTNSSWNTANGAKASTTGNLYGIYDTSGGAGELVMAKPVTDMGDFNSGAAEFVEIPDDKYYDKYQNDEQNAAAQTNISHVARGHLGDASREILRALSDSDENGWYGALVGFPKSASHWINRSSVRTYKTWDDIFVIYPAIGGNADPFSFRVVLTAQDGNE